jgi:hypothetical protein
MKATVNILPEENLSPEELYGVAAAASYHAQAKRHNLTIVKIVEGDNDDEVTVEGAEADLRRYIKEVGWSTEDTGFEWVVLGDTLVTIDSSTLPVM